MVIRDDDDLAPAAGCVVWPLVLVLLYLLCVAIWWSL
jgi:hypothetical protein